MVASDDNWRHLKKRGQIIDLSLFCWRFCKSRGFKTMRG
jgi:hypothetical protein